MRPTITAALLCAALAAGCTTGPAPTGVETRDYSPGDFGTAKLLRDDALSAPDSAITGLPASDGSYCGAIRRSAYTAMWVRQQGATMEKAVDRADALERDMLLQAYSIPRLTTRMSRLQAQQDFARLWAVRCEQGRA